jgi:hypothetical protein
MTSHLPRSLRHFLTVASCMWAAAQAAPPVTTTVYPTGTFPLDMHNVQAAIDRGGTVKLKATDISGQPTAFDFGPPDPAVAGGVNLTTDVSLIGETVEGHMTTISGGFNSIFGQLPVKSRIQGIDFEGSLDSPIALVRSTGADIVGNRIRGIVPLLLFFGATEIEGIFVSGFDDPLNAVTGRIRVTGNTIEVSGGDFVNGMQFDSVAADIEISSNTVNFLSSDGKVQSIGILVFRSHGAASIVNNRVTMGNGDPNAFPSGIFVGGDPEARYTISANSVVTNHPQSDGMDIVAFSNSDATQGALVLGNHVTTHSLTTFNGGIVFEGAVRNSLMAANRVDGTAGNAVQILGLDSTLVADSNLAVGNDISHATSLAGDVFFGTYSTNNLFVGRCNTYTDQGTGNRILCGHAIGAPALHAGVLAAQAAAPASRPASALPQMREEIQRARNAALQARVAQH